MVVRIKKLPVLGLPRNKHNCLDTHTDTHTCKKNRPNSCGRVPDLTIIVVRIIAIVCFHRSKKLFTLPPENANYVAKMSTSSVLFCHGHMHDTSTCGYERGIVTRDRFSSQRMPAHSDVASGSHLPQHSELVSELLILLE